MSFCPARNGRSELENVRSRAHLFSPPNGFECATLFKHLAFYKARRTFAHAACAIKTIKATFLRIVLQAIK